MKKSLIGWVATGWNKEFYSCIKLLMLIYMPEIYTRRKDLINENWSGFDESSIRKVRITIEEIGQPNLGGKMDMWHIKQWWKENMLLCCIWEYLKDKVRTFWRTKC